MTDIKINGHKFCPSQVRWRPRDPIDVSGGNRPIYPPIRTVELRWELVNYEEWASLQSLYDVIRHTGTAVVQLPAFPTATGTPLDHTEYSGVVLGEPQTGPFFAESYPEDVILIISNIITD